MLLRAGAPAPGPNLALCRAEGARGPRTEAGRVECGQGLRLGAPPSAQPACCRLRGSRVESVRAPGFTPEQCEDELCG